MKLKTTSNSRLRSVKVTNDLTVQLLKIQTSLRHKNLMYEVMKLKVSQKSVQKSKVTINSIVQLSKIQI